MLLRCGGVAQRVRGIAVFPVQPSGLAGVTVPACCGQFNTPAALRTGSCRQSGAPAFCTHNAGVDPTQKQQQQPHEEEEAWDLRTLRMLRMHPDQLVATSSFDRRWLLPASIANHASLGAIFAWSALSQPLLRVNGVLVPSAADWALGDISTTFSLVMGGFVWGAVFGKYHERWGPRACGVLGGLQVGTGFGLGSIAIASSNLPLLYFGGLVWGLAMGWAYVPALANVIKWYPESKGFASAAVVVGYGGGPLVATPLYYTLIKHFQKPPTFVGPVEEVTTFTSDGRLYCTVSQASDGATVAGSSSGAGTSEVEVVVATAADIAKSTFASMASEGVYIVGSGSTGAAEAFACMGVGYCATVVLAAYVHRLVPATLTAESTSVAVGVEVDTGVDAEEVRLRQFNVPADVSIRTPQFWLMYGGFGLSITGAYGMLSSSSIMLSECYGGPNGLPEVVTPLFCAQFVSMTAAFNLGGRLFWANASDYVASSMGGDPFLGRKRTVAAMWGLGPPAYISAVYATHTFSATPSVVPLGIFCLSVGGILSCFGGSVAMRPPMCGDLFGTKNVGLMSAYQLSVVMPASFAGPQIVAYMRDSGMHDAITDLTAKLPPGRFEEVFGAAPEQLDLLVANRTVTINRLLPHLPEGTIDPTPFCYDKAMYLCAFMFTGAWATNALLKPLDRSKYV